MGVEGGVRAAAAAAAAVGVAGNATKQPLPLQAVAVRHVNAMTKVETLQKMLDERALLRRVKDRWETWKRYDAATFIGVCVLIFVTVFWI